MPPRRRDQARTQAKGHLLSPRVETLEDRRLLSLSPADPVGSWAGAAGPGPVAGSRPEPFSAVEKDGGDESSGAEVYALRKAGAGEEPGRPGSVDGLVPISWHGTPTWQEQGGWIARFDTGASVRSQQVELISQSTAGLALQVSRQLGVDGMVRLQTPADVSFDFLNSTLSTIPGFRYIVPNFVDRHLAATPNDPLYPDQYHHDNVGQTGGTADADVDTPEAWDITTGSPSVVVGVIDSGIDIDHPDLVGNLWVNPGEVAGNGIDDDGNGYVDDVHGYDFIDDDGNPDDTHGHGTHVSGIIGAEGDNGIGVTGVAWDVQLMGIRIFDTFGSTTDAAILEAVAYSVMMKRDFGVNIPLTNNSWGGGPFSQALLDVINEAEANDQLFIAAAGNGFGNNNDTFPFYPASYDAPNIISVASTDHNDDLSGFSNLGPTSVDVAAPGSAILSTAPPDGSSVFDPSGYVAIDGTSMATPIVSGIAALGYGLLPSADYPMIRDAIFAAVDPLASLDGLVATGGRVNALGTLIELDAMVVTASSPADGDLLETPPTEFVVEFSFPYDPATVDPGDLTVNGIPADSVALIGPTTLSYSYTASPVTSEGLQTMAMAGGAVLQLADGDPLLPFEAQFRYDVIVLDVVSTSPPAGSAIELPLTTILIDFNEEVDPSSVDASDVFLNMGSVVALAPVDADTLEATVAGLDAEGTLTLTLPAGRLTDGSGNPNAAFQASYELDYGVVPFPAPLDPSAPGGSLAFEGTAAGIIGTPGDVDTFTLELDPGQTIALVVDPSDALLLEVALLDGGGNPIAGASPAFPGEAAVIQPVLRPGLITAPGATQSYSVVVSGLGGTTGSYDLRILLNAAIEPEEYGGPGNDETGSAQGLGPAFIPLANIPGPASVARPERAVVSGGVNLPGYQAEAVAFSFEDISDTGSRTLIGSDDGSINLSAANLNGFAFDFYGQSYSSLSFSSNGLITFGGANSSFSNTDLTTSPAQAAIAPLWEDLFVGGSSESGVYWQVLGSGDDQRLVIQWHEISYLFDEGTISFQAVLSEADGSIRFNYLDLQSDFIVGGEFGSVGVKDAGPQGPDRLLLAFDDGPNQFVGDGLSTVISLADQDLDVYAIELGAHETVSLSATVPGIGDVELTLLDPSGIPLAMGHGSATNLDETIVEYLVPTSGTYFARVEGAGDYQLVVTRNASFEAESNDSLDEAHALHNRVTGGLRYVLGHVGSREVVVNALDTGWYNSQGLHDAPNPNILAGNVAGDAVYRNFFAFDLAGLGGSVTDARLLAYNPPGGYISPDPSETFELFDVSTPIDSLLAGGFGLTGTFDDLGTGTSLGATEVSSAQDGSYVEVGLNPAALAQIEAALGSQLALGGALTSLNTTANELLFAFSGNPEDPPSQLLLSLADRDYYRITVPGNRQLAIETYLPGGGPGAFANGLDPMLRLFDASGNLLATNEDGAADGINARISHRTPRSDTRTYFVEVSSQDGEPGEYALSVHFANGVHPPFQVEAVDPAPGDSLKSADTITVDFNDNLLLTSVDASDLLINGTPATGVEVVDGNTLAFSHDVDFPAGEVTPVTLSIAGGSILDAQGTGLSGFSSGFSIDRLPPRIVSASVAEGDILEPGDLTVTIAFDEPMSTASIDPSDTALFGLYRGTFHLPVMSFDPTGTVMTLEYFGLPDDSYSLRLFSGDSAFEDLTGNDLDGEPTGFPTGDGVEGGDFVLNFAIDPAAPSPLGAFAPVLPPGSLIFEGSAGDNTIAFDGDVDSYTVELDPGQTLTVLVRPDPFGGALQPTIELLDPSNNVVATATAPALGELVLLQTTPLAEGGTYTLNISGSAGSQGRLEAPRVILNAALEEEPLTGASNDDLPSAQDIDGAFIDLDGTASRAGVLGVGDGGPVLGSYGAQAVTFGFEDISATGTPTLAGADDATVTLSPAALGGFEFDFYGQSYSSLSFSSNGLITFGGAVSSFSNTDFSASPGQAAIAPLWDDLELFSNSGAVYWQVLGSGDDQRLVIQWHQVDYFSSNPGDITFQAVLREADGSIQFNYLDLAGGDAGQDEGLSATVGIKDAGFEDRLVLSFNAGPNEFVGTGRSTRIAPAGGEQPSDHYSFTVEAGQTITAAATHLPRSADNLPQIELYDPDGNLVAFDRPVAGNLIANGSFESGDFTGWTAVETATPFVPWLVSGAGDGSGFFPPTSPQDGQFVAWNGFDGAGPMEFVLFQDVTIPAEAASATLEWQDRVQWDFTLGGNSALARDYEVAILDPSDDSVLATLHSFTTGPESTNPFGDTGWLSHSVDVSAFIGQDVRVHFLEVIPEAFEGPGQYELDGVSLTTDLAGGPSAENVDAIIGDFVAPTSGTYTVRVIGDGDYSLVVNRDAAFDTESNDDFASAQGIGTSPAILGAFEEPGPTIIPGSLADAEGNSGNAWPYNIGAFGIQEMRHQQLYSASAFDSGGIIDAIRFRLDDFGFPFEAAGIDTEIRLSYAATTVATVSPTFASNVGAGQVTVFDGPLDLSSSGDDFDIVIDVEDLFDYDPTQGDLLVEIITVGAPITSFFDASGFGQQTTTTRVYAVGASATSGFVNFDGPGSSPYGLVTAFDILAGSGEADWYAIDLEAGQAITLTTRTPGDGPGEFDNTLDPQIELYDENGLLVAPSTVLEDGRNEEITFAVPASGTYRLRVAAEAGSDGSYVVSTEVGNSGTSLGFIPWLGGRSDLPISGGLTSTIPPAGGVFGLPGEQAAPSNPYAPAPSFAIATPPVDLPPAGLPSPAGRVATPESIAAYAALVDELLSATGGLVSEPGIGDRDQAGDDEIKETSPDRGIPVHSIGSPPSRAIDRLAPTVPSGWLWRFRDPNLLAKAGPVLDASPVVAASASPRDRKTR
jgi:subtilisin family serine protease